MPADFCVAPRNATPIAVRVAGLGTAKGKHWIASQVLAEVLSTLWPELAGRACRLLDQSDGRYLSRPAADLAEPLSLGQQGPLYIEAAMALASHSIRIALDQAACDPASIGALVVVSCTGFALPGLDVRLVAELGLRRDVIRMPFTQLGCAGGVAGIARAAAWVRGESHRRALVVAVEVPSLTFRPGDRSTDNLLSALVFGDGAGALVIEDATLSPVARSPLATGPLATAPPTNGPLAAAPAMHMGRSSGVLIDDTVDALGYELADDGFRVILSRQLPRLIETHLPGIVREFLGETAPCALEVVALHPGGAAILAAVQRSLDLQPDQLAASQSVFRAVGNTSSAAIFFVLDALGQRPPPPGSRGLAIAFGPGLAVELIELSWGGSRDATVD